MNHDVAQAYLAVYRDGLLHDTLPFWIRHGIDREHGGYLTALDQDGTVIDTDKGMWQQGRFAWLLSHLYNHVEPRTEWLEAAAAGIEFIRQHGFDEDGRMWFSVTREGQPLRKRRYTFSECFAVMAFAEYARATGDGQSADEAQALFQRIQYWNSTPGLLPAKFTGTRPMKSLGRPMIEIGVCQVLRAALGDDGQLSESIDRGIAEIATDFVNTDLEVVLENVGPHGEVLDHFDGRLLNPGHALEAAWFILLEGKLRDCAEYIQLGCRMLRWMWHRGWDSEFGGLFYYRDLRQLPVQ